jgi:putative PIN family toxin of toxin-antitoxin system
MRGEAGARRPRLFLDANILISGLVFDGPEFRLLCLLDAGSFEAVASDYVLGEVRRVLAKRFGLAAADVEQSLSGLRTEVARAPAPNLTAEAEAILRGPADAPVLAAAWQSAADALVTGDKDLHAARQDRVPVARTAGALRMIADRSPGQADPR